jgi:hypothetical protein
MGLGVELVALFFDEDEEPEFDRCHLLFEGWCRWRRGHVRTGRREESEEEGQGAREPNHDGKLVSPPVCVTCRR